MDTLSPLDIFRKGLEKFILFTEEEWLLFLQHLDFTTLKRKSHFSVEDKVCDHIGFIVKGSVRYYNIKNGEEISGYFCFEKEFICSYKSFLTRQPAFNYIQAMEPTELILISYQQMQLMLNHPLLAYKMERFGRLTAEYYLCCYEDRINSFITKTPEERYLEMIKNDREILLRIPQRYVANFLGITPVSLSRIRKRVLLHELLLR